MKKLLFLFVAVVSLTLLIPKETSGQTFEVAYQQQFFRDTSWTPYHDQIMEMTGKYVLSYQNCQEMSLEVYVRATTRLPSEGAPSEGIFSFDYMPNQNIGIKIGGGVNFSPYGSHDRGRGELFFQNELYYIKLVGEISGATGYYWNGTLILKVLDWLNVGFVADKNWRRSSSPEDGFGPRAEINVVGTPLTIFGGAIFPWKDGPIQRTTTAGAYIGGSASF